MAMTKKDYEAVAKVLKENLANADVVFETAEEIDAARWMVTQTSRALANRFGWDNPRFDTAKFLKAAGVETVDMETLI